MCILCLFKVISLAQVVIEWCVRVINFEIPNSVLLVKNINKPPFWPLKCIIYLNILSLHKQLFQIQNYKQTTIMVPQKCNSLSH